MNKVRWILSTSMDAGSQRCLRGVWWNQNLYLDKRERFDKKLVTLQLSMSYNNIATNDQRVYREYQIQTNVTSMSYCSFLCVGICFSPVEQIFKKYNQNMCI